MRESGKKDVREWKERYERAFGEARRVNEMGHVIH